MAPLLLNDGVGVKLTTDHHLLRWWSVVNFTPTPLCPQMNC